MAYNSFSFNFDISNEDNLDKDVFGADMTKGEETNKERERKQAEVLAIDEKALHKVLTDQNITTKNLQFGRNIDTVSDTHELVLRHLCVDYVEHLVQENTELLCTGTGQALHFHTDLISSIYEGGMKIWECSIDLVEYLHDWVMANGGAREMAGKKVLELGCGAGLPGIYSLTNGASVHFQDYNKEVLGLFTVPNVAINLKECIEKKLESANMTSSCEQLVNIMKERCEFIAGDWGSTASLIRQSSYDVILTSETIYNPETQPILYDLMKYGLKEDGVVIIAAKSYYFGVGGGTRQFEEMVREDGVFDISCVKTIEHGIKREILQMKTKQ